MKSIRILLYKVNAILFLAFALIWIVPFNFALSHYLIVDNYEFYTKSKSDWSIDKSILNRLYVNALDLKLRRDWKATVLKKNKVSNFSSFEKAKFAVNLTKSLNADLSHLPVPQSLFGSIVHGYGHCDELNGLVAYIMHGLSQKSELYALWDKENLRSQHSVARIESDELGVFYLDAYKKNVPYFGIKEGLTKKGMTMLPLYDEVSEDLQLSKVFYLDGQTLSSYTFLYQIKKAFNRINAMIKKDFFVKSGAGFFVSILGISSANANEENVNNNEENVNNNEENVNGNAILKLYVSARVHHIYGKLDKAKKLYNTIIISKCNMNECIASAQFYKRLSS